VEAYLGLVPRELSSGERQRRGRITKAGNTRMRWLLVQAAVSILRCRHAQTDALRAWATGIAARRGKKIAVVALARRLAGILDIMALLGRLPRRFSVPLARFMHERT
jgi:transposase